MTDPQVAIFMLSIFIFLVLLGFPIAFTLIPIGVGFGYYAYFQADNLLNNQIFYLLNQNTYSVMESDILVAIPLFLFMGYVVERANIVNRLFFSLQLATRHLPGSMAVAALATCAIFATASGIIGAVVTLMGLLAFPAMVKANYHRGFAAGVICAGGTLGILIPSEHYAYRLCSHSRVVCVKTLCCSNYSRIFISGLLYGLCSWSSVL